MSVCYLACEPPLAAVIRDCKHFATMDVREVHFPITASDINIEILVAGPSIRNLKRLAATICDWNLPPVTLFVLDEDRYTEKVEELSHHPRVGRSVFFCKNTTESLKTGLDEVYGYHCKRRALNIDNSISGNFCTNNVSPRWLFQSMMEHLDEYIYFKDADSRFLAVSQYLVGKTQNKDAQDVLGKRDFDFFDQQHAQDAYDDERKIATGELTELYKEEEILYEGKPTWVASRKLPLHTRSHYLAGTFGLSRDITDEKQLHQALERNHSRMQSELMLAKNLQDTLIQQAVPTFVTSDGNTTQLEVATKYVPSFHLSGDFFSVTKTHNGGAAIIIADVMGHGVRSAMVTAMIQIAVQQLAEYATQPAEFMTRLNKILQRGMQPSGQAMFATAAYCYIDLENCQLNYVQAGARHGIYIPADDSSVATGFRKDTICPALGLLPDTHYLETSEPLSPGDEIMLYTDGIEEAAQGEDEYGEQRMIDFLAAHRSDQLPDMLNSLLATVQEFTHSPELEDDVCLIALRIPD